MLQFGTKGPNIGLKIRSLERGVGVQVPLSAPINLKGSCACSESTRLPRGVRLALFSGSGCSGGCWYRTLMLFPRGRRNGFDSSMQRVGRKMRVLGGDRNCLVACEFLDRFQRNARHR